VAAVSRPDSPYSIGAATIRDAGFKWFIGVTCKVSSTMLVVAQLTTLKEALVQAWYHHLHNLELDLADDIIAPLTTGSRQCKPSR